MNVRKDSIVRSPRRQEGAVLFVSLIFLLILTLIGVMLARTQTTEERMAQNDGNHELAVEAAEAALRYAEMNVQQGNYDSLFASNQNGLYFLEGNTGSVYSSTYDWSAAGNAISYAGPTLSAVPQLPQFIVESLPAVATAGNSADASNAGSYPSPATTVQVTQITAHATGGDQSASATLRSIYERE